MKISYIYLQLRVSSGYTYPDLNFKAPCLGTNNIIECTSEEKGKEETRKRRSHKKNTTPKAIDVSTLSSEERKEIQYRIKGRRNARDLVIETYNFKDRKMSGAFAGEQTKSLQPELSFVCEDNRGDSSLAASEISRVVSQANNPDVFAIPHLPLQSSKSKKTRSDSESSHENSTAKAGASSSTLHEHPSYRSISYFNGNPAVAITNGIVQIFKSNVKTNVTETSHPKTNTLLMLSVRADIGVHGVIHFSSPFMDVIEGMEIIRDQTPNQFMVLLQFKTCEEACHYYLSLNNQAYR